MGPWPSLGQSRWGLGLFVWSLLSPCSGPCSDSPRVSQDWLSEPALGTAVNLPEIPEKLGLSSRDLELGEGSSCGIVCGCASEGKAWFAVQGV